MSKTSLFEHRESVCICCRAFPIVELRHSIIITAGKHRSAALAIVLVHDPNPVGWTTYAIFGSIYTIFSSHFQTLSYYPFGGKKKND